jgi:DNA-binding transcriptional regulator YdaS (Cro superfamily)
MNNITKKKILHIFGTQAELAKRMKVSSNLVGNWFCGFCKCPAKHAITIEYLTCGAVMACDIRPDIFRPGVV